LVSGFAPVGGAAGASPAGGGVSAAGAQAQSTMHISAAGKARGINLVADVHTGCVFFVIVIFREI
jgi:hypothetical protein